MSTHKLPRLFASLLFLTLAVATCALTGCQDGPLYALKTVNPWFTMREWRADEQLGVTDHERRTQLGQLGSQIAGMPIKRQDFWAGHLEKIMNNDPSPEMRRLAVRAASNTSAAKAMELIEKGLDDDSIKVRMEACRALGKRKEDNALQLLASTAGTETDEDVRQAALTAIGNHRGEMAVDALKLALSDNNPATRHLAVESLKQVTGKNYGDRPEAWLAALQGDSVKQQPTRFTDSILSRWK